MAKTPAAPKTRTVKVNVATPVIGALNDIAAQIQALEARRNDIVSVIVAQAGYGDGKFTIAGFEDTSVVLELPA